MSEKKVKIAVVGGGFSGIGMISTLKEDGFDPICFERSDQIGGTWHYKEETEIGTTSIMPTTVINHSKEMGALSNYPPRKEYSNYMRHSELYECMKEYVTAKDVRRHIKLNYEVLAVKRTSDYEESGRWSVTVKNRMDGSSSTEVYDAVFVCIGHVNRPKMASYPQQDSFKGKIMHTHSLKGVSSFKGQNVVIVGIGCSALDAAVEISSVAKQVYLSTRSGAHIINRVGPHGYPIDYILLRRYFTSLIDILPTKLCSWYVRKRYLDPKFDQKLYTVKPQHHVLGKDPCVNDHIGSKLLNGSVIQKKDVKHFTEHGVIFETEDKETPADTIVMATGYDWAFPFLEEGTVVSEDGRINLYKCMYPTHLKHPTLAIIGFLLPFGPGFPVGEMQCRLAAHYFAGRKEFPSSKKMKKDVIRRHKRNEARYPPSQKMTIRVDFVQYMDELATLMGVKPNFWKLFFTDIPLFSKLWFGPCVAYQYRLRGPHKWDGAREAIMTVDERLHFPLRKERK